MGQGAGPLVGLAGDDGADQELQVVVVSHQLTGQVVTQFLVAGGAVFAGPVGRVDEADAEEVGPHAIDDGPREVRVVGRGHPLGQRRPGARFILPARLLAVEEAGLDHLVLAGNLDLAAPPRLAWPTRRRHVGEEAGELPELVSRPLVEGMVVALGTFQFHAQE